MRERQQLLGVLVGLHGWHPNEANMLIDDFAHGLAEQIRAASLAWGGVPDMDADDAAALIDPQAQRATTEGDPT